MPLRDSNGPDGFAFVPDPLPPTQEEIQPYMDQARDWVNLNCPNLEGNDHDAKVLEIAKDLWSNDL